MACLVLPWVNPVSWGPSAAVVPWMVSTACALTVWMLLTSQRAGIRCSTAWGPLVAAAWLAAALISSVAALCQYFDLAHLFVPVMNQAEPGTAFANLRQRNQFATLATIGMAALLWWAARGLPMRHAVACMVLLAVANAASASRTGLLQIVLLTVFTAVWPSAVRRKRLSLCLIAVGSHLVASFLLPQLLQAVTGDDADSVWQRLTDTPDCSSRLVLWSNVLHLIAQRPWLGWGWGELDYAHYMTLYEGPRFCDILDNAHNLPLHLAVELGVPAAFGICAAACWWLVRQKPWREPDPLRQLGWCVLGLILVHSMVEYPLWYGPFQLSFFLGVALLSTHLPGAVSPTPVEAARGQGLWRRQSVVAAAALGTMGLAAYDYYGVTQVYLPSEQRAARFRDDPLSRARRTWLFQHHALFAELTLTPLSPANAQWTFETAGRMLHHSPEPRVIEKLIESSVVLGRSDEIALHLARFRAAFPGDYAQWSQANRRGPVTEP
jgi:O-antigen ligase